MQPLSQLLSYASRFGLTRPSQRPSLSKYFCASPYFRSLLAFCFTYALSTSLQINITATLGTLNVAAEVDGVKIKGEGEMHMTLSSSFQPNLNRQLQFVTYTNTLFHPSTADTGEASDRACIFNFLSVISFLLKYKYSRSFTMLDLNSKPLQ